MRTRRLILLTLALLAPVWLVYLVAGGWLAQSVDAHWGASILSAADGNVISAGLFVQNRERDGVLLYTLACLMVFTQLHEVGLKFQNARRTVRWLLHTVVAFVLVNVWLAVACHTTLFWCLLWEGRTDTTALARFELKHHLLLEVPAPHKAAILGNSQARAQLDEGLLNQQLGPLLFTGELHFPGAHAFDLWLVHRHLKPEAAQTILCYVSEMTFYDNGSSEATPFLFGFADWPDARDLGALRQIPARKIGYGLLGDALPVFALRDALAQRILGLGVSDIRQRQHDQAMKADQAAVIDGGATSYRLSPLSDFQKHAFEAFAADCARQGQTLVIIAGQLNPKLGTRIDPIVRQDMLAFLRGLRQHSARVVLIDDCPAQVESEYDDLTHVNPATQEQFTKFIAEKLRAILPEASITP